jgi:peptidoglycan/LPS O-acetylase OafA/YrhL
VPRNAGEIDEIDGLRGIAILAVMVHRLWPRDAVNRLGVVADAGWIGVDLFFVVSGFLITRILLETRDDPGYFRNFYARRVLRIFPLYYLFVGTLLVAFPLAGNTSYLDHSGSPLWYMTFLGNIPEALLGNDPPYWLAPVWSLAIEEQFYLTFPWLVYWLGPQRLGRLLVVLFLSAPLVRLGTMLVAPDQERIQYLFTLCRVDAIAAGCMVALVMRWKNVVAFRGTAILIACCAGAIALISDLDRTTAFGRVAGYSFVAIGFGAMLVAVLTGRERWWAAPLRFVPLRYVGKLCFGLYLLHRPADTITASIAGRFDVDADRISWIPVKIAVAVTFASLSWFAFEKPILRLKRHFVSSRHPSAGKLGVAAAVGLVLLAAPGCDFTAGLVSGTPDASTSTSTPGDGRRGDAASSDGDVGLDSDASVVVTSTPILYPFGLAHSPITAGLARRLAMISGGDAQVFAKVGDSITATSSFATCFDGGNGNLGNYGSLASTIDYFRQGRIAGASPFARASEAAHGGWTGEDLLAGSPSAVERELVAATPRYSVVLFGTNDNRYARTLEAFTLDLWTIVDGELAGGIIPILSTLPPMHSYPEADARVPLFNLAVRAIAQGRQVPLVDFYSELQKLPGDGISSDGIHPTEAPAGACSLTAESLTYGYNTRNLLTVQALARARTASSGISLDSSAPVREGEGTSASPYRGSLPLVDLSTTRDAPNVGACGGIAPGVVYAIQLAAPRTIEVYAIGSARGIAISVGGACVAQGSGAVTATVSGSATIRISGGPGEFALIVR